MLLDLVRREHRLVEAIKPLTLEIYQGEIVGLIGPNGAGKTTLLKMIAGLLWPSSGTIDVFGLVPSLRQTQHLFNIGFVMGRRSQLWWELAAFDSVQMVASAFGLSQKETEFRLGELASLMAVSDLLQAPLRSLSMGERMKFELTASLIHRPKLLLLDEPTLGLDLVSQRNLRRFIRDCNQAYGTTVLLASHYLHDIETVCSRVLVLDKGDLMFDGSLSKLRSRMDLKRVRASLPTTANLSSFGLERRSEPGEWVGVVDTVTLSALLTAIGDLGVASLSVEEASLEDVIARVYSQHRVVTPC